MRIPVPNFRAEKLLQRMPRIPNMPSMSALRPLSGRRAAWLAAAFAGLFLSFVLTKVAQGAFYSAVITSQEEMAVLASRRTPSMILMQTQKKQGREVSLLPLNPVMKAAVKQQEAPSKSISSFSLTGTLPGIGAWLHEGEGTYLVLRGQEFGGFKLELIDTGRVLFTKDGESYPLYLELGGAKTSSAANVAKPVRNIVPTEQRSANSGVVKATEDQPGTINKEVLDRLLMNPYEEISKINLTPEGSGMRLMRVDDNSMLSQLGMQKGDVLTGINGIPIKDMANLNNAISSMLSGNQFNLEFSRESKPIQLGYSVK